MLLSSVPYKFTYVWGATATTPQYLTTPIPAVTSSPAASQQLGFPPATANPSGTPPNINDFNGVFNYLSLWAQWAQAGGPIVYDSTFSANNDGYPQNAILASGIYPGVLWISLVDNNTVDPDTGGANWLQYPRHGEQIFGTDSSWIAPAGVTRAYVQVWGSGSGGLGGAGSSGAGGGYAGGWVTVTPATSYPIVVGTGSGANSEVGGNPSSALGLSATGGGPALAGPSAGGTGAGGTVNLQGQAGTDLTDSGVYSVGLCGNAIGGNGAGPGGGFGGNINAAGAGQPPTYPGGGGGANAADGSYSQAGAQGLVRISW